MPNLFDEEWRPVLGYEGVYEVSDHGRVRSVDRMVRACSRSGTPFLRPCAGRIVKPKTYRGYHHVYLKLDGGKVYRPVHRLVLEAFVGPRPDGLECCHDNGIKTDNRLTNLRWDTYSANQFDKVRHGEHHNAKKTHCIRRHEFTPENTQVYAVKLHGGVTGSARKCRECTRMRSRARQPQQRIMRAKMRVQQGANA